jgi:hypothetical protein
VTFPNGGLLSRGLRRAIALIEGGIAGGLTCREVLKGEKPSQLRAERKGYQELLAKMEPSEKGVPRAEAPKQ